MIMITELIITHRAVFHSNTPPDDDNVDTVNGSEDKEDNVPQGCVLQ